MATEILRPDAAGDIAFLDRSGGRFNWEMVCEEEPDEFDTYVANSLNPTYLMDLYNLPPHSVGSLTINFIKIYFVCCYYGVAGYGKSALKSDSTITEGAEIAISEYPAWTIYSQQWNTNPATDGDPWTWDDIDALQIGVAFKGGSATTCYCTQVYVEVDFSPPAGVPQQAMHLMRMRRN